MSVIKIIISNTSDFSQHNKQNTKSGGQSWVSKILEEYGGMWEII